MGACCSSVSPIVHPLSRFGGAVLDQGDIDAILIKNGIKIGCYYTDASYNTILQSDFKKFANSACVMLNQYKIESADCDDSAKIMLGRLLEHYGRGKSNFGTCIGYVHGNLNQKPGQERYHACLIFVNEKKELMIYDQLWNEITPWNPVMTPWIMLL